MKPTQAFLRGLVLTSAASIGAAAIIILAGCNIGGVEEETIQVTYEADPVSDAFPTTVPRDATETPQSSVETTSAAPSGPTSAPRVLERDLNVVTLLGKDGIPAIRSPEFVNAADAEAWMNADEPIIGVEIDGDARAYPTAMLSRHEIVNDTVGGAPLAVTW